MPEPFDPEERVRSIFDQLRAAQGNGAPEHQDSLERGDSVGEPAQAQAETSPSEPEPSAPDGSTPAAAGGHSEVTARADADSEPSVPTEPGVPPEPGQTAAVRDRAPSGAEPDTPRLGEHPEAEPHPPAAADPQPAAADSGAADETPGGSRSESGDAEASEAAGEEPLSSESTATPAGGLGLPGSNLLAGIDLPPSAPPSESNGSVSRFGTRIHPASTAHPLPRCLAVANQKGGVGKTTTTVNLGAALAEIGYRVLVVDLDPQGNATTGLGVNARNLDSSVYDVILHDVPVEDVIEPTSIRNLFVVPATIDLAGAEIELVPVFSRELRLRRALQAVTGDFDFVLIDCPPSLGLLTVNALAAAGEVLVPIQCEYYALEGLGQLLRNVGLVQGNLNNQLDVSTIVLTMYDARTKLAEQVADDVREHFGERVCRNVVPRTVRLSEAPSFGQPIITFDPSSRGAIAYRELAKEVSGGAPQRVG
jgi:chromosome partitioning protein